MHKKVNAVTDVMVTPDGDYTLLTFITEDDPIKIIIRKDGLAAVTQAFQSILDAKTEDCSEAYGTQSTLN